MTKVQLIESVAGQTGFRKTDVEKVVDMLVATVKETIRNEGRMVLTNLGTFKMITRPARIVKSKLAGSGKVGDEAQAYLVPAHKAVKFSPAKGFEKELKGLG
jgi:nucleoid DNA-binding protein